MIFSYTLKADVDTSGFHVHFKEQSHCLTLVRQKKTHAIPF